MSRFVGVLFVLLVSGIAAAATPGKMEVDGSTNIVQGPAPNGNLSQLLTDASTTVNATGSLWWELYAPADCKVRITPTAAKGAYPQFTVMAGERLGRIVNKATPFLNFSGCGDAELSRQ